MAHLKRFAYRTLLLLVVGYAALHSASAQETKERVGKLAKQYGIDIVLARPQFPVKTFHGAIDGKEAKAKDVESYVPILVSEWSVYPVELMQVAKLKRIILCQDLSFAGQLRTAIPDFEHHDLYFDVARGRWSETYIRAVIHHEFFHIIDLRNGTLYKDERWERLLPKGTKYGRGGKNAQDDATQSLIRNDMPGFLNGYSATGVEEDKAEIFAHMLVSSKLVAERAKADTSIREKVKMMREVVEELCPKMDSKFWESASKLKRTAPRDR